MDGDVMRMKDKFQLVMSTGQVLSWPELLVLGALSKLN